MENLGPLTELLAASGAVIYRDHNRITAEQIVGRAKQLSEQIRPSGGGRIAALSPTVDGLAVALAASEMSHCSVVVYRAHQMPESLIEQWKICGVIDSELQVVQSARAVADEPSTFLYIPTSGTTGEPKLVQQTMRSLMGRVRRQSDWNERSRWLFTYQPATFGGLQVLLTALQNSADLVSVSHPTPAVLAEAALSREVTHISGTPTFWRAFVSSLGERVRQLDLKQITLGGEIADEPVLQMLKQKFPQAQIRHIYASTEAGALFSVRDGHAGFPATWLSSGIDGVRLRIRQHVLEVQSPRAMVGYAGSSSSIVADDGWLITGDHVEQLGERVYFRGRQDSVLNVGGAKVKPEEVEEIILAMQEVMDAHVYGVPNPLTGMVVAADVVPQSSHQANGLQQIITTRLRAQLEPYKIPRLFRIVDSITLSAAGKKQNKS